MGMFVLLSSISIVYSYTIIWSDGTRTEFEITDAGPVCDNGNTWRIWNESANNFTLFSSLNDCYREDGWPSTTCCTVNRGECVLNPDDERFNTCPISGLPAPMFCSDYTPVRYNNSEALAEAHCNGFDSPVAVRTIEDLYVNTDGFCSGNYKNSTYIPGRGTCYDIISNCRCVWDSADKTCKGRYSESDWVCPGDTSIEENGDCTFSTTSKTDDCENSGFINFEFTSSWSGTGTEPGDGDWPLECSGDKRDVPCLGITKLGFFTLASAIVAIILIIIIYIIVVRKKKKFSKAEARAGKKKKL